MRPWLLSLCATQVLLLSHLCTAVFRVITPVLDDKHVAAEEGIAHEMALFGRPEDGHNLIAPLVLAPAANRNACSAFNRTELRMALRGNASSSTANVGDNNDGDAVEDAFVLLLERGECHFVEKVRHAQQASAAGVVIYNSENEENNTGGDGEGTSLPIMADDGTGGDIHIPSLLIHHEDALALMDTMRTAAKTIVLINWEVPSASPDHRVDFALWFSSRSSPALHAFVETFAKVVREFENGGNEENDRFKVHFTPFYDVFEGSTWGCLGGKLDARPESSHCEQLCIYDEKFCAYDPESNTTVGLDGKDVLEEDVRQLCIFQFAQQTNKTLVFWEYLTRFQKECSPPNATRNEFNAECSRRVQASLSIPSSTVDDCASQQGGRLLDSQVHAKHKYGAVAIPQFTVNDVPLRGSLSCEEPITVATCAPLRMICAAFQEKGGSSPKVCFDAFWSDTCFAPLEIDDCGDCNLRESDLWNRKCAGCDGIPNSRKDLDECGVCGGDGVFDICGRCLPKHDAMRDKSCLDCKGVPNGDAKRDSCGICDGHGSFDACGLCLDAKDPRRQNFQCRVIEDPDAVQGKIHISGIHPSQFRGAILESFQHAVAGAANVSVKDVLVKSVDSGETSSTEVLFFIPCRDDGCRVSTTKLLRDPSASLTVAIQMRARLDEVAYGLNEAASIERVRLHSISTSSADSQSGTMTASGRAAEDGTSRRAPWGVAIGLLCFVTLVIGFLALKTRDDRIRRDFQQMFTAYTPLTSLDHEDNREGGANDHFYSSPFA